MTQRLTEAQEGLWFFQQLNPQNPILNTGQYLSLTGTLSVERFQAAVRAAIRESGALHLTFAASAAGPCMVAGTPPEPEFCDLSGDRDPEAEALRRMQADSDTAVDLSQGSARFVLYQLGPERFFWYQRIHHLATDGYGIVLFTNRVAQLYSTPDAGPALAPLEQALAVDADYRSSPKREADRAYWLTALADLPEIQSLYAPGTSALPMSGPGFLRHRQAVPAPAAAGLLHLAQQAQLGWPDVLTALTAAYCQRFTGGAEAVVGVPFMDRLGSKAARVPAMVMNVLPLRLQPDETLPLTEWLKSVSRTLAEGRRHGRYRSELLRRELGRVGGTRRLYGALINVQPFDVAPKIDGLKVGLHILGAGAVDDITFTFRGSPEAGLSFEADANPALYSPAEVEAHSGRLLAFLEAAVAAGRLADVPTVSPAEAAALDLARDATQHPVPVTTLTALIERQLRATPEAVALRFDGQSMSYAQLDAASARLAGHLQSLGAGPGQIVALALERSFALVVALVAVLRAGAGYLPLDPAHPDERLAGILAQANPVAVLASEDLAPRFDGAVVLSPAGEVAADPQPVTPCAAGPDDLAYVIFTSGSTGAPKGVMIEHQAIVNRLLWMQQHYNVVASDRILQKTPATFDVSVWEFFLPLITGARLVIAAPGAHRDPKALARVIRDEGVTTLHFVPSMLSAFLAAPDSAGLVLRQVFCSGEELTAEQRDRFHRRIRAELHNLYGPTEAAVDVSFWPAGPEDQSSPLPIGYPVWNTRLEVLDQQLRDVPDGVAGQLYLGGMQLARGYMGRPDLTAERFIADPRRPGERLYATGDLARRRPDGAVVYLGRNDHQVKIRGLRIELGEIEAALMSFGSVREAVVLARDGRLLAYYVPVVGEAALRRHLAARLPDYMIPAALIGLPEMPVTSNGKLDRKALPEPVFRATDGRDLTPVEHRLARLYADVLGLSDLPGAEGDFFLLGGDSLSAVRLSLLIEEVFGMDPGLGTIFENPVLAQLAQALQRPAADQGLGASVQLYARDGADWPLALIHPAGGLGWGYRGLATVLAGRNIYALQSPMLDADRPEPASLSQLAADYADRLQALAPGQRWHLAGWSVGGIIAQAVAAELEARGAAPGMLAVLDSYPADVWRDEPEADAVTAMRALLAVAGFDPETLPELQDRASILNFLKTSGSALGNLPDAALEGVVRTVAALNRLVRRHQHQRYNGELVHITAALDHQGTALRPELWDAYVARVTAQPVPFRHPELTSPEAVARIAPLLNEAMQMSESRGGADAADGI